MDQALSMVAWLSGRNRLRTDLKTLDRKAIKALGDSRSIGSGSHAGRKMTK